MNLRVSYTDNADSLDRLGSHGEISSWDVIVGVNQISSKLYESWDIYTHELMYVLEPRHGLNCPRRNLRPSQRHQVRHQMVFSFVIVSIHSDRFR